MNAIVTSSNGDKTTVVYSDETTKVFGKAGKVFTESSVSEDGNKIELKVYALDGALHGFNFPVETPEQIAFVKALAGRAMEDRLKTALASVNDFEVPEGVPAEEQETYRTIPRVIAKVFQEIAELKFPSRNMGSGVGASENLSLLERAYILHYKLDLSNPEHVEQLDNWFDKLTSEEKIKLKSPKSPIFLSYRAVVEQQRMEKVEREIAEHQAWLAANSEMSVAA